MQNGIGQTDIRRDTPQTSGSFDATTAPQGALLVDFDFGGMMAARIADHRAHCTDCRKRHEAAEARYAEYGTSIQRRDRLTLGLRAARTQSVTR
jgi:hypothetical protein